MDAEALVIFFFCGVLMVGAGVLVAYLVAPTSSN